MKKAYHILIKFLNLCKIILIFTKNHHFIFEVENNVHHFMVTINKCTFLYLQIMTNFGSHYPLTTTVVRV